LGIPFKLETTSEHSVFQNEITVEWQYIEWLLDALTWRTRAARQRVMHFCGFTLQSTTNRDWNWIELCWARGRRFPFVLIFWQKMANRRILHNDFLGSQWNLISELHTPTSLSPDLTTTQHRLTPLFLINVFSKGFLSTGFQKQDKINLSSASRKSDVCLNKGRGTRHEGAWGDWGYRSTHS
jgi:hypothetical protein